MDTAIGNLTSYFKDMLERFIAGGYDPLDFSYDFPSDVVDHGDELREENPALLEILDDNLPEICAEYERGMDPRPFIDAVRKEYERAFPS